MNSATEIINILNIPFGASKIVREECYPYLAYINANGAPVDTMFQGVLFDFSMGDTLLEWESNLNALFDKDGGIYALNDAAADVKNLLKLPPDKCLDVYVKAPLPKISLKPFGDINQDGITEKLLDADDCLTAFSLFVSYFLRYVEIGKLKNLNLKGWVLEPCSNESVASACSGYLAEKGFSVFTSAVESLVVSAETNFSQISSTNPTIRVFCPEKSDFIISCAFSQNQSLRDVYDSLYILLNPQKFFGNEVLRESSCQPNFVSDSPSVMEDICVGWQDETVETVEISETEDFQQDAQDETEQIPVADEPCAEEETVGIPAEDNKAGISVEISITEERTPHEEPTERKSLTPVKLTKKQKNLLCGAGIAAATLGIAYLVGKFSKD